MCDAETETVGWHDVRPRVILIQYMTSNNIIKNNIGCMYIEPLGVEPERELSQ